MNRISVSFSITTAVILSAFAVAADDPVYDVLATRHVYGTEAREAQVLDAHLLVGEHPSPVLIHIVSGGWTSNPPPQTIAGQFQAYHDFGFSVVAVCHRTINEDLAWPAPADDVARAVQFIRMHAGEWNIDPDRISIAGRSSGGHVAMMVAFGEDRADPKNADPLLRHSTALRCVIQQGGPTNLSTQIRSLLADDEFMSRRGPYLIGRVRAVLGIDESDVGTDEFYRRLSEISPINLVTEKTVPVLMLYSGPDDMTSLEDPRLKWDIHTPISGFRLAAKLKELGVDHELVISADLGRGSARSMEVQKAFLLRHNNIAESPNRN